MRFTKNCLTTALMAISLTSMPLWAADELDQQFIDNEIQIEELHINETSQALFRLKTAVISYYLEMGGWPTSLTQITSGAEPFFNGSLSTSLGTFSSKVSSSAFYLVFDANNDSDNTLAMVSHVASISASALDAAGEQFEYVVPTPQTATVVDNMLNRVTDADGHNAMLTDLHMGGNDITDINSMFANEMELTDSLTATSISVDNIRTTEQTSDEVNTITAVINDAFFDRFTINSDAVTNTFDIETLVVNTVSTGTDVIATNTDANIVSTQTATMFEVTGDTAELENAEFNVNATTTSLTVDQVLTSDEAYVDVIKGYTALPIKFTASVNFSDLEINAPLELNSSIEVANDSKLNLATLQSLTVGGTLTSANAEVKKGLAVGQNFDATHDARIFGDLTARDVFATTADFSSTVNVMGKVTVKGALNVGNSITQNGKLIATTTTLYDNGQALSAKYLGLHDTAYDSDKVDNYDSTEIAQRALSNTFAGTQTFRSTMNVSGNVYVGGRLVVDSSGYLYDGGRSVRSVYATKSEASSKYSEWDSDISQLKSVLDGKIASLEQYTDSVEADYIVTMAKANQQEATLSSLNSDYASIVSLDARVNSDIIQLNNWRETENASLISAKSTLDQGIDYTTRSCTRTTTKVETGVNSGQYTTTYSDGCPQAQAESMYTQYGNIYD